MTSPNTVLRTLIAVTVLSLFSSAFAADDETIRVLFIGDQGHHRPRDRYRQLAPVFQKRKISMEYTEDVTLLRPKILDDFDGVILYANIDAISPQQAKSLLDFVAGGKGFIPLHCATFCFRNSPEVVALMGGQFKRHGAGVFSTRIADPKHPIMRGFSGFSSWDESYIHHLHNEKNRTVLEYREEGPQAEGQQKEPWTWIRTHGKGRVFYTAWGHDQRTWSNPGFQNLVERGVRWACKSDPAIAGAYRDPARFEVPQMTKQRTDVAPFEFIDVGPQIPNYEPGKQWGSQGKPHNLMQRPLAPAESQKHYVTPVGFKMELFAAEPDLQGKPIAMNWDERGRLWICETYDYPNELQPRGQGRDRIRICEDTDGDGRADRFVAFAENLSIPTAIAFHRDGVIVQNGIETLYLKDTDGDDVADLREVLITGWTLGDTHGGVSNIRYGLDNSFWGMQGYNNSQPTIRGEKQQSFRMGFFRFNMEPFENKPAAAAIEFVRSTNNNTWGLGISEDGLIFGSTANRNPSVFMPIANRYYERVRGWAPSNIGSIADTFRFRAITENVRQVDHHGGYTAGAGHALYTARNYPATWWNRTAFVCGPTGHLVGAFVLRPDGAGFRSTSPCNLTASDDQWSAPIAAEVGPDGNVWVLDWYNYIVQHNPTPQGFKTGKGNAYESKLRDKKHGRIYRLVYTGAGDGAVAAPAPNLRDAAPAQLVDALNHPTMLWRLHAQRLLVERGEADVVDALLELAADNSMDEIGLNVGAIHALWTLHGLGQMDDSSRRGFAAAMQALQHPSAGVRRNALRVLPPHEKSLAAIVRLDLLNDRHPQVQLAAVLALADMPASPAAGLAVADWLRSGGAGDDRWLNDAAIAAAASHAAEFFTSAGRPGANIDRAVPAARIVADHVARSRPTAATIGQVLTAITNADPQFAAVVVEGLASGWRADHSLKLGGDEDQLLVKLLERVPAGGKAQLVRLADRWGSRNLKAHTETIVKALTLVVQDSKQADRDRLTAAGDLLAFRPQDPAAVDVLLAVATPQSSPELARGAMRLLSQSSTAGLGERIIEHIGASTPLIRDAGVGAMLARPATTRELLAAIKDNQIGVADLLLEHKQLLNAHPDAKIRGQARQILQARGGLPNPDRQKVLQAKLPLAKQQGDLTRGKAVYKKHCSKCHRLGAEGENIGPDLTGMAAHPKAELLGHVLDPSRSVEGNFRLYTVVRTDGRILTGMLASEARTAIEVIDVEAKRHAIAREDIDELIPSPKSVMPEGFEKDVTDTEIVDLLEFLTAKGKYLPLDLRRVATSVTSRGMFFSADAAIERLVFPDWQPKRVGDVPFHLVNPQGGKTPNAIMLHGPQGKFPPTMPKQVTLPVNAPAKSIHFLSGVSGWGHPLGSVGSVSMIVRIHYASGAPEDVELKNGVHFADYIRRVDVPRSQFAFNLKGRQIRYLQVKPQRKGAIREIELIKGPDATAPVVMAVTVETGLPEKK
ncbi:MAG: ThuA domain-containing protein [Pirellulaceae bacterium]|nr:ThuA domain-containing protein [Pirellulaceae bacterium]